MTTFERRVTTRRDREAMTILTILIVMIILIMTAVENQDINDYIGKNVIDMSETWKTAWTMTDLF